MLKTIADKINLHESLYAIADKKRILADSKTKEYYWLGVREAEKGIIKDLKLIQEKAEQDISSIDHCLDTLRGL